MNCKNHQVFVHIVQSLEENKNTSKSFEFLAIAVS